MNLDQIEADGKNCSLHPDDRNHRLLILAKTFSEKLFEMLSDQIECDGKNRFLPLYHFRNNLSFTFINTFSKKSTQDEFRSN